MKCPICNVEIPTTETIEFSFNNNEDVEVRLAGKCPVCGTPYIWTSVFKFDHSYELEVDE